MTTTTTVVPDSPPRTSYIGQAAPQATAMPQTDESHHSLEYYKWLDRNAATLSKIDSPNPVSRDIARISTNIIHDVLREVFREPVIQWTRHLAKNKQDWRDDDIGLRCNASMFPATDSRRLIRVTGTSEVAMRVPSQVIQTFGRTIPLCELDSGLHIDLARRIAVVFESTYNPEFQLTKAFYEKTTCQKLQDIEFFKVLLGGSFDDTNNALYRVICEVQRRLIPANPQFQDETLRCITLTAGGMDGKGDHMQAAWELRLHGVPI